MSRRLIRSAHTPTPARHRRTLRFMRLERRYLLSGDFGELFENDDDFDFDDDAYEFESYHDDDDDYDDDHYEDEDDDDDDNSLTFVRFVPLSQPDESASNVDVADDDTVVNVTGADDLATIGETTNITASLSDSADAEIVDTILAVEVSIDLVTEQQNEFQNRGLDSSSGQATAATDKLFSAFERSQRTASGITDVDPTTDSLHDESPREDGQPFSLNLASPERRFEVRDQPADELESDSEIAVTDPSSDSQTPKSAAMTWLGSLADDLSVVDEALSEFLRESSVAVQGSIGAVFEPAPLVTASIAVGGVAARAAYRRRQAKHSLLEDDFNAVQFDVRLYPEIFG